MTDPDPDIISPITPRDRSKDGPDSALKKGEGFTRLTGFIQAMAVLMATLAVGLSLWFFSGFAENDTGIIHLITAFFFSLGLGSLAFGPACVIVVLAGRVLRQGPSRQKGLWAMAYVVPWIVLGVYLLRLGGRWLWAGIFTGLFAIICVLWSIAVIRLSQRNTDE